MDWAKTYWKSFVGFTAGLAAVAIMGIMQAITDYKPVICTDVITTNCTSQFISTLYYSIVPVVTAFLLGLANWLKNRQKMS